MTFIGARWFTPVEHRVVELLVVHCTATSEWGSTARGVANYFARTTVKASAHAVVDNVERIDCVTDMNVAWGAKGANHQGLHLELVGLAGQTVEEWSDEYSYDMIVGQAAPWLAEKARIYDIPLQFVKADAMRRGASGVTTHAECEKAWPNDGHWDPGPNFPMGLLLDTARRLLMPTAEVLTAKVAPVLNPPWPTVDAMPTPDGGVWLLGADGGIATVHTVLFHGSPVGQDYWKGRTAARITVRDDGLDGYMVTDVTGALYRYP